MKPKKCAPAHVWIHKICFTERTVTPFVFTDRYDPNKACKHTWWVLVTIRKFFPVTQIYTVHVHQNSLFWSFIFISVSIAFEGYMKPKKCAPAHVWIHKICFTQRLITPSVFKERYDPNEACKHTWWVVVTARKSFTSLKSTQHVH